ncbi:MAG TPA: hypothetical protein DCM62_07680 [Bacteroidales bacterium]|nr:hypothetical protein [Bacteroidales bacterium]
MKTSIIILLFFAVGLLAGRLELLPEAFEEKDLSRFALFALMLLVGVSVGANQNIFSLLKQQGTKLLWVPLATIVGTFAGALLVHPLTNHALLGETLAVGAGFGYYSLSSIIISEMYSEVLGVTALLANITREVITLLLAPLMVIWLGKLSPIASGGATSMDTTLPIIVQSAGKDFAIMAVFHGIVLTVLVPVMVSFILSFL